MRRSLLAKCGQLTMFGLVDLAIYWDLIRALKMCHHHSARLQLLCDCVIRIHYAYTMTWTVIYMHGFVWSIALFSLFPDLFCCWCCCCCCWCANNFAQVFCFSSLISVSVQWMRVFTYHVTLIKHTAVGLSSNQMKMKFQSNERTS